MFSRGPMGMGTMRGSGRTNIPRPKRVGLATGGGPPDEQGHVPIVAAGGEFVLPPEVVKDIGHGSLKAGHRVLDLLVLKVRKEHIKTLKSLKPPKT